MGELKPHQRAMLEVLIDGEEHARDELLLAGVRACDPDYALAMYQRAARTDSGRERMQLPDFSKLSTTEQLQEIRRQRQMGAKNQAQKTISHLESRKFIETTQFGRRSGRQARLAFRLTDLGRKVLTGEAPVLTAIEQSVRVRRENGSFSTGAKKAGATRRRQREEAKKRAEDQATHEVLVGAPKTKEELFQALREPVKCKEGHVLTDENSYTVETNGTVKRVCRRCANRVRPQRLHPCALVECQNLSLSEFCSESHMGRHIARNLPPIGTSA